MQLSPHPHYDSVIVGARCAGAFTALHLARGGQRVLVVDRDRPGTDTLSTHALMRLGVTLLDEAGVLPDIIGADTPAVRKTVFTYGGERVSVDVAPKGRAGGLYAPRRHVLDRILVDAARAAGAAVIFRTSFVRLIKSHDGRVIGVILRMPDGSLQEVRCDTLIGADGRASAVAEATGAEVIRTSQHATASVYSYVESPGCQSYEWLYGPGTMAGLIPTNGGLACAFASVPRGELVSPSKTEPFGLLQRAFRDCGAEADLLPGRPVERIRRFAGAPGHIRQATGRGWALVGDAGYFKDPATAHGITDALRDAWALARALLQGSAGALRAYGEERDALSIPFFDVTDRIASLDWSLEEVRALHIDLHQVMRAEQEAVLGGQRKSAA